jgi:hypothetical protein
MKQCLSNAFLTGMGVAVLLAIQPASAAVNVCLNIHDIATTKPNRDGTTITFKMRDGKLWRNNLKGPCPDLAFSGFAWKTGGMDEVCENEQSLRVLQSGQICMLGKFTQVTSAPGG